MSEICFINKLHIPFSLTPRVYPSFSTPRCALSPLSDGSLPIRLLRISTVCAAAAVITFSPLFNFPHDALRWSPTFAATTTTTQTIVTPQAETYIYDSARLLPQGEEDKLNSELAVLEKVTGYKIILVTRTPASPRVALPPPLFSPNSSTTLILVDPTEGNILRPRPSPQVLTKLTDTFWGEWTNRYGNQFYVRDHGGADLATIDAVRVLINCLKRDGTFRVVPGIGSDQEIVCATCASLAGVIAGVASRTGGKTFNPAWFVLFSPLWATLLFSFGLGPVIVREGFWALPTLGNLSLFGALAIGAWWWIPIRFRGIEPEQKKPDV